MGQEKQKNRILKKNTSSKILTANGLKMQIYSQTFWVDWKAEDNFSLIPRKDFLTKSGSVFCYKTPHSKFFQHILSFHCVTTDLETFLVLFQAENYWLFSFMKNWKDFPIKECFVKLYLLKENSSGFHLLFLKIRKLKKKKRWQQCFDSSFWEIGDKMSTDR